MALSRGINIAVTGAGSANTGFAVLTGVNIAVSAAATVNLRKTSAVGTVVAQQVFTAAGQFSPNIPRAAFDVTAVRGSSRTARAISRAVCSGASPSQGWLQL